METLIKFGFLVAVCVLVFFAIQQPSAPPATAEMPDVEMDFEQPVATEKKDKPERERPSFAPIPQRSGKARVELKPREEPGFASSGPAPKGFSFSDRQQASRERQSENANSATSPHFARTASDLHGHSTATSESLRVVGTIRRSTPQPAKDAVFFLETQQGQIPISEDAFKRGGTPLNSLDYIVGKRVRLSGHGVRNGGAIRLNSISRIEFSKN